MGYVYFLKHKKMSPIKIGMTNSINLDNRISSYNTASPYGIDLIGFVETKNPKELESKIHNLLKGDRLNGEWFDIDIIQAQHLIKIHSHNIDLKKRLSLEIPFDCSGYYLNELKMFKCFFDNLPFDQPIIKKSKIVSLLKKNTDIDTPEITKKNAYDTFIEYYMCLNNYFYRADDVLAKKLLDLGFSDFTDDIDNRKGKRTFSIKKKGRYIKFDYINISIFDDFGYNIFYATKISKQDLIEKLNYLTYKS